MIWFFLWSILTAEGHTVDVQFVFTSPQECRTVRESIISASRPPHGARATVCQQRPG